MSAQPIPHGSGFMYLTDDRDHPVDEQRALVIFQGNNGDWYVQIAPAHGRTIEGVRICTSGGAASACPGLGVAIAQAYRAMKASAENLPPPPSLYDLAEEVEAWRAKFPRLQFDRFQIVPRAEDDTGDPAGNN